MCSTLVDVRMAEREDVLSPRSDGARRAAVGSPVIPARGCSIGPSLGVQALERCAAQRRLDVASTWHGWPRLDAYLDERFDRRARPWLANERTANAIDHSR